MKTIRLKNARSRLLPAEVRLALHDLQSALRQTYGVGAPDLLIYGSYARGEAQEASDVDILLVYPGKVSPGAEIQRLGAALSAINLQYQVLISVLPASTEDLQSDQQPFWQNVRSEAVALV